MENLVCLAEAASELPALPSGGCHVEPPRQPREIMDIDGQEDEQAPDFTLESDESDGEADDRADEGNNCDPLDIAQQAEYDPETLLNEQYGLLAFLELREEPDYNWQPVEVISATPSFKPAGRTGPRLREPLPSYSDYFHLFLSRHFWVTLTRLVQVVKWTNLNAERKRRNKPEENKGKWHPLDIEELKAFLAVQLTLETEARGRRLEDLYSSKFPLLGVSGIPAIFPRLRLEQIQRYLHFVDEESDHTAGGMKDKLYKIRPLIIELQKTFQAEYIPRQQVSVDEGMVPFKGRLGFKQYTKDKPIKWGIKVFMLADATTGYNMNFEIYSGSDALSENTTIGLATRSVITVTQPLHGKGYEVYVDRFYTSPLLFNYLLHLDLGACGTIMCNRSNFPVELKPDNLEKLKPGQWKWLQCQNTGMVASVWQDKRPIAMLSTIHTPQYQCTVTRRNSEGAKVQLPAPPCVKEYNEHMGGVDLNGRMTAMDRSRRTKWYIKLERKMLMWAVYNAYLIWHELCEKPVPRRQSDFRHFSRMVASELVGGFSSREISGRKPVPNDAGRLTATGHFPQPGEGYDHRCVVCIERNKMDPSRKLCKTTFLCSHRLCQVYLCIKSDSSCWADWHTKKEFWR